MADEIEEAAQRLLAFLPEEKIGIVVLQNSWNSSPFVYEFVDRYLKLQKLP